MLTPNMILRIIDDARETLKLDNVTFAKKAGLSEDRWSSIKRGRFQMRLEELPNIAKAAKLSFSVVAPHHDPFMNLTCEEAAALLQLAEHYKRNGPKKEHVLRTAVEKLTGK